MTTTAFVTKPGIQQRLREGPIGDFMDLYAAHLMQQGYTRESGRRLIKIASDLSCWLKRKRLALGDLDELVLDRYYRYRKRRRYCGRHARAALGKVLTLLRDVDACNPRKRVAPNASEILIKEFRVYLTEKVGLRVASFIRRLPTVRRFLDEQFGDGILDWSDLSAETVIGFVQRHAHDYSPASAQSMCLALRSFFRYLTYRGYLNTHYAKAVPSVRQWKLSGVPQYLSPQQIQRVLVRCDRSAARGKRDYAILLLLARLGLRSKEVVGLSLDDIDWSSGQFTLRNTKTERSVTMPLLTDVGEALADYLKSARPPSVSRRVFLRESAPHVGFADSAAIYDIVKSALARASVDAPRKGGHLFRHSLATEMLRSGATLREIGHVLRHRDPDTTRIYAKVDLPALRTLALPWPGEVR
jgi:site-specific recombinase XerD